MNLFRNQQALIKKRQAQFNGCCILSQKLIDHPDANYEWYILNSDQWLAEDIKGSILTCKADKMPPTIHVARGWCGNIRVSEKFRQVVQANQLSGIDYLWLKDNGRFAAQQWYIPVISRALGRGIDHPWYDPKFAQNENPFLRSGHRFFNAIEIRQHNPFEKRIHRDLIPLFNPIDPLVLSISSYYRFLRDFLPDTDFAYCWLSHVCEKGQTHLDHFDLCISKKAKNILLEQKVITNAQLEPIRLFDSLPANAIALDNFMPNPAPNYGYEQLTVQELHSILDLEWNKFTLNPKPQKIITDKMALDLLIRAKRERPDDFHKALAVKSLHEFKLPLPESWLDVLLKSNGGYLNDECELLPLNQIADFTSEKQSYLLEVNEDYQQNLLHVASCVNGDWFALDISERSTATCPVLRISHEECQAIDKWPTIADFIYEMLSVE